MTEHLSVGEGRFYLCKGEFVCIFLSLFRFFIFGGQQRIFVMTLFSDKSFCSKIFSLFFRYSCFYIFKTEGPISSTATERGEVDVCASTPPADDAGEERGGALLVAALARRLTMGRRETSSGVLFFLGNWAGRV